MTRLLVSVRSVAEAAVALAGGAAWIDAKEPARGPLGAVESSVAQSIQNVAQGHVPFSVACGELGDGNRFPFPELLLSDVGQKESIFAKLGLAGSASRPHWRNLVAETWRSWPAPVRPIAVVYADWELAEAPPPEAIIEFALQFPAAGVLFDTFCKASDTKPAAKHLLEHFSLAELAAYLEPVREQGLLIALAGSLSADLIQRLLPLQPDFFAVRGAACQGGRGGSVSLSKVRHLNALCRSGSTNEDSF